MKIKRILLFILIFFLCLFIKNNVNAYVINEGGIGKFYLQDLPFDDSGAEGGYKSVFLFNNTTNEIYCIQVENYNSLGFDRTTNRIYKFDNTDNTTSTIFYYKSSIDLSEGLYIGQDWISTSSNYLTINTNFEYVGGTTTLYPCFQDTGIITVLPDCGINWSSDFVLSYHSSVDTAYCIVYPQDNNNVFTLESNSVYCRASYNSEPFKYDVYRRDGYNSEWTLWVSDTLNGYNSLKITNLIYFNKDLLDSSSGSVLYLSTNQYFKGLYEYTNFPYILNSQEDLAKGEEDIIIMPRRF